VEFWYIWLVDPHSIYIHIPFCQHRCGYCDFNTYSGLESLIPEYVRALLAEINALAAQSPEPPPVHTIFFGGGTPSLLPAASFSQILESLAEQFQLDEPIEITVEANPGTLTREYLRQLRHFGVNRLSLGMQSAHPSELILLERGHSYREVIDSLTWARQAGFDNINLDLIYGLPEQLMQNWQQSLNLALGLHPEHFSLYALTLEHGTPFGSWSTKGLLSVPDPDLAADMFEWAAAVLADHGYRHYEISNWAQPAPGPQASASKLMSCRHNLQYWRNLTYFGLGAGAHGFAAGCRTVNVLSPSAYIHRLLGEAAASSHHGNLKSPMTSESGSVDSSKLKNLEGFPATPATSALQRIDRQTEMSETMIMGLRLIGEGVSNKTFQDRFGQQLESVYSPQIERLCSQGLLEWSAPDHQSLRLAERGILIANRVFMEFV
jgi:oxygen-independent coproporphyrinogen III oxidase